MINVICWSKDRACQLDLTLSSYKKYFKEWQSQKLTIIYTYSNENFKKGYDKVISLHPEFNWVKERNFRNDTLIAFNNFSPYTSFIVDDDIFIDYFSIEDPEFKEFFTNEDICCLSPRMAPYVNFCYTQNQPQPPPTIKENGTWEWKKAIHDWNYPTSVACFHVFRTKDLVFLNNMMFRAPNSLEGGMCSYFPTTANHMICFKHSKCICSTNNKVQTENNNRHDNLNSLDDLNINFINGKRLSVDANHQYKLNMAHGPLKYEWRV